MTTQEAIVALEEEANRLRRLAPEDYEARITIGVNVHHPRQTLAWREWVSPSFQVREKEGSSWLKSDDDSDVSRAAFFPAHLEETTQ